MKTKLSPLQRHINKWNTCALCPLHLTRKHVVHIRGSVPAEVAFIAEGPGMSEDVIGRPLVGPAGRELDKIILHALELSTIERDFGPGPAPSMTFFNIVGCIPKDRPGEGKRKDGEPTHKEIKACHPRVEELLDLVKPKLIVCVGKIAEKQAETHMWVDRCENIIGITHPAAIMRADITQQALLVKRATIQLAEAFSELY